MSELASLSASDGRSHPVSSSNDNQSLVPPNGSPSEDDISLDDRIRSALSDGDFAERVPVNGCPVRTTCGPDSDMSEDSDSGDEAPGVMGYMPLPQDPDAGVDSPCGYVGVGVSDENTVSSPGDLQQAEGCVVSTQGATSEAKVTTPLKKGEL